MGIKDKLYCPFCGELQEENDFQTKCMACMLDSWTIEDIHKCCLGVINNVEIYHECRNCKKWIEINLPIN